MKIGLEGQEVGEPVVRDSLGEALEEYAPSTPEEGVLFKDGDPEADLPPPPTKRLGSKALCLPLFSCPASAVRASVLP